MVELEKLQETLWVAVDTETSGLNPWKYEIIEIGAVRFSSTKVIERFNVLIKPLKKQNPKSKQVHNISDEELSKHGILLCDAMQKFYSFIKDSPLLFHNAPFDVGFLSVASNSCAIPLPDNLYYDTLQLSRNYLKNLRSYSLSSLKDHLNIDTGQSHRALADAEATAKLFQYIYNDYFKDIAPSKKKLKGFLRYQRKLSGFEMTLPENLEEIENYFKKYIRQQSIVKIEVLKANNYRQFLLVVPKEVLVFNQAVYLKAAIYQNGGEQLFPLKNLTVHDKDLGPLKLVP